MTEIEPNWDGINLNYDCTHAEFARQLNIDLWKLMAIAKYINERNREN